MRVILTDIRYKMSLAPLRSLSGAGYRLLCCEQESVPDRLCLGFYSKYAKKKVRLPDGEDAFLSRLDALCADGGVILPVGRKTLRMLSERRKTLRNAAFLVSDTAVLDKADDKAYVFDTAKRLGVPVPETWFLSQYASIGELARAVKYPCIIKYRDGESLGLPSHERYAIAKNAEEFAEKYAKMHAISPDPLVQEYLTGRDIGVAVVMDEDSRPVDFICYVSEREYPVSGGPTCLCRTFFDREVLKNACAVLRDIGFTGIAMLDFKAGADGVARLLEINPRIWGSAYLCTLSGSEFFESYVRAALGEASPLDLETCEPGYRLGIKMRFFPQSLAAFLSVLKRDGISAVPGALKTALDPRVRDGLFTIRDPKPYLRYLMNSKER